MLEISGRIKKQYYYEEGRVIEEQILIQNKKEQVKKHRGRRILLVIFLIFLLIGASYYIYSRCFARIQILGGKVYTQELGQEFHDPGTRPSASKVIGEVDTSKVGEYILTYYIGRRSVKRTVYVVDSTQLVLGLKGSKRTMVKQGEAYVESGAFAIDKSLGPVSGIKISGKVDTSKPGTYHIKYKASSGHLTKSLSRDVEVIPEAEFMADTDGIPVMMYHYVYTDTYKPDNIDDNAIHADLLRKQLQYLSDEDYYFPSFAELRAYIDGKLSLPAKSVILTFDDAAYTFLDNAVPLFNEFKIPAVSFVIGVNDGSYKVRHYASPYIEFESHSNDMHRGGGHIGHGGRLTAMSQGEIEEDLAKVSEIVGSNDAFAYPFGDINDTGKSAVKAREILCSFSTNYDLVRPGDDYLALPRIRVRGSNSLPAWIETL